MTPLFIVNVGGFITRQTKECFGGVRGLTPSLHLVLAKCGAYESAYDNGRSIGGAVAGNQHYLFGFVAVDELALGHLCVRYEYRSFCRVGEHTGFRCNDDLVSGNDCREVVERRVLRC